MSDDAVRPIIIKRKKVSGGGGHHGGAWKVAYADFVTAMMAFFMLMWLLNATTEKQRKGLADYFSPTIAVARISGGGDGAFSGDSLNASEALAQSGRGGFAELPPVPASANGAVDPAQDSSGAHEMRALEEVQLGIVGNGGDSLVQENAKKHITTRLTDEGLIVEIFDLDGAPLFDPDTNDPTPTMVAISDILNEAFSLVTNPVAVASHSAAISPLFLENPSWTITTDRAQSTRVLLEKGGLNPLRVARVTGHGQQSPRFDNPMATRNNRLEVILLRSEQG